MPDPIEPFRADPRSSAVLVDFDGTLSHIVPRPGDARPASGAPEVLRDLTARYGLVAIVSGRAARELVEWLGDGVEIWGAHGAQLARGGEISLAPAVEPFRATIERARDELAAVLRDPALEGCILEDKEAALAVHYRTASHETPARALLDAATMRIAGEHGLVRTEARKAFELRPPVDLSKRSVVAGLIERSGVRNALFVGDDIVDVEAFDALDRLAERLDHTLRVGVMSPEAPDELVQRADLLVEGVEGAIAFLRSL